MKAKDARSIANVKNEIQKYNNIDEWWEDYSKKLFDYISKEANSGMERIYIEFCSKFNILFNGENMFLNKELTKKVIKELEHLGYNVHYFKGSWFWGKTDSFLIISW